MSFAKGKYSLPGPVLNMWNRAHIQGEYESSSEITQIQFFIGSEILSIYLNKGKLGLYSPGGS